eukprot:1373299-Amorphochlora_amoeboformis.AAC.1
MARVAMRVPYMASRSIKALQSLRVEDIKANSKQKGWKTRIFDRCRIKWDTWWIFSRTCPNQGIDIDTPCSDTPA